MITLKTLDRTPSLAELKVSYRRGRGRDSKQLDMPLVVRCPISAETYLRTLWDKDTLELREEFVMVCVNTARAVLGWVKLATGGIDAADIGNVYIAYVEVSPTYGAGPKEPNWQSGSRSKTRVARSGVSQFTGTSRLRAAASARSSTTTKIWSSDAPTTATSRTTSAARAVRRPW